MVGPLGPEALAAVGLGGQVYWLVQAVANLAPTGLAAIVARAVGACDAELADRVLRQSILLGAVLGAITMLIGLPLTQPAIAMYGVEPGVVKLGSDYFYWLLWGTVPFSSSVRGCARRATFALRSTSGC